MRWVSVLWLSMACAGCSLLFHAADSPDEGGTEDGGIAATDATVVGETCGDTTCPINGYCVTTGSGDACQCLDGFQGLDCTNINDCVPFACRNGGTCVDEVQSYSCDCIGNWTGDNCDDERCPVTTIVFSNIITGCVSSPLTTSDVEISAASNGMLCAGISAFGVGNDEQLGGNESLTLTFPEPVFLEVNSNNVQGQGETLVVGTRAGSQVYSTTWTHVGTLSVWAQTSGGTLDTLTMTAQNNGSRSLSSIKIWSECLTSAF